MPDCYQSFVSGAAEGPAVVLDEGLSFWGGVDPGTGVIIDPRHPQLGTRLTGSVMFMPAGRGSSSSSSTIVESIRRRTHPSAVILTEADGIVVLGAVVAKVLYQAVMPVGLLDRDFFRRVASGDGVALSAGSMVVTRNGELVFSCRVNYY